VFKFWRRYFVYVLDQKTITRSGNHNALMKNTNFYSDYWRDFKITV